MFLLTAIQTLSRVPRSRPPIKREAALCKALASPAKSQKLPCTATAAQRTRKISIHQPGGCRAGKFGEMREVWRGNGDFATQNLPVAALPRWTHLRKGVLLPPRSSRAPPRSFPYPFLRIYLRTKATARRASGIRIAKTMIQTTKTVTETFRRADGRTCDSPIGYCRSSPASHERIAAV